MRLTHKKEDSGKSAVSGVVEVQAIGNCYIRLGCYNPVFLICSVGNLARVWYLALPTLQWQQSSSYWRAHEVSLKAGELIAQVLNDSVSLPSDLLILSLDLSCSLFVHCLLYLLRNGYSNMLLTLGLGESWAINAECNVVILDMMFAWDNVIYRRN